jgi:hypothetical protein
MQYKFRLSRAHLLRVQKVRVMRAIRNTASDRMDRMDKMEMHSSASFWKFRQLCCARARESHPDGLLQRKQATPSGPAAPVLSKKSHPHSLVNPHNPVHPVKETCQRRRLVTVKMQE